MKFVILLLACATVALAQPLEDKKTATASEEKDNAGLKRQELHYSISASETHKFEKNKNGIAKDNGTLSPLSAGASGTRQKREVRPFKRNGGSRRFIALPAWLG